MKLGISRATATLALLTCLVCPVLELFDRWDHTLQTGQDTEYSLVVLALCLGVAYVLGRFVLKLSLPNIFKTPVEHLLLHRSLLLRGSDCLFLVRIEGSPPLLALRI